MKCFVIAMQNEADPVVRAMRVDRDLKFCGKRMLTGSVYGERAGLIVCGIGKVNAACGTQIAIDELGADSIINLGVAGGLNKSVEVGEIYEISHAVQYDFDLTQLNGGEIGTLDECKQNYLPLTVRGAYPARKLATGDRFNDSPTDYKLITKTLGADIRDMEGAAVAQVCMHAKIKCSQFKIISDMAGAGSTTAQYLSNLSKCFRTLDRELEKIIKL